MEAIDWYYRIVSGGLLIGTWLATAIFLYVLLKPFVNALQNAYAHGYGLKNIRRIAQKYNGDIRIDVEEGRFCLSIMVMLQ